jgi:hypothetical protein
MAAAVGALAARIAIEAIPAAAAHRHKPFAALAAARPAFDVGYHPDVDVVLLERFIISAAREAVARVGVQAR